jgi:dTDP-4-dehydrorhamnose 3,5-epimerase-like enzyme
MSKYLLDIKKIQDTRGSLTVLENLKNIPFEVKRVYFLNEVTEGSSRGFHAHKKLKQMAFCLSGSCQFIMDDGLVREELVLSRFNQALLINPMVWHEMHDFSSDCVLLVLADDYYVEDDYIREYKEFVQLLNPLKN